MPMLDGFRAVAAFSVVLAHGYHLTLFDGVTAFFVLSGFLITTLLIRERDATGSISLRSFYARRTLRIFPAYYALVLASYVIDKVAGNPWPSGLAPSAVAYVVNYFNAFNGQPSTSIAHLWSLGVEEQFYLLWPALFIALSRFGMRGVQIGLATAIVGGLIWRPIAYFSGFAGQAYLYNAFDARFDNLAMGCLLATVAQTPHAVRIASVIAGRVWMPLITIGLMTAVTYGLSPLAQHLFGFTLYSFLIAVFIAQLLQQRNAAPWRVLDLAPVRFLGTISYPIYLYHGWGIGLGLWLTGWPPLAQFLAGVVFTVLGACGSYFIVEKPFLALKQRFQPRGKRTGRVSVGHGYAVESKTSA
jgi:peptidoglycan/LPS O-acetylase OafA/YrhL